jgi:hypothetical protein
MPTCLKHNQTYNYDEYCTYCGKPKFVYTTTTFLDSRINEERKADSEIEFETKTTSEEWKKQLVKQYKYLPAGIMAMLIVDIDEIISQKQKDVCSGYLNLCNAFFDNGDYKGLYGFMENVISQKQKEAIEEFIDGRRCISCGNLKVDNLSDWCSKCLEDK